MSYFNLKTTSLVLLFLFPVIAFSQVKPDAMIEYKQTPQCTLSLHTFYPDDKTEVEPRAVIISFFGGGWTSGSPTQFYAHSRYYASLGLVAISAEYRVADRNNTTPFDAVSDAKSAVRWLRENAAQMGIDPQKIIVAGGSAGGHIAACTALIQGYEDYSHLYDLYDEAELANQCEDYASISASSVPNAMILFNPVLDTTKNGYGADKLVGRETDISPTHHVRESLPPTLIMHGTSDRTVPFQNAVDFTDKMTQCGNSCTLIPFPGEDHGFFNVSTSAENHKKCMEEVTKFLESIGVITSSSL